MVHILPMLSGLLAIAVGIVGYSIEFENFEDLFAVKVISVLFFLLAVEFVLHQFLMKHGTLHELIHTAMALTVFSAGAYGLKVFGYRSFSTERFKEALVYTSIIWLLDKSTRVTEYYAVYYVLIVLSVAVAVLSFYVVFRITKLRAFFIVDREVLLCGYFVAILIGLAAVCMCVLPLILSAVVEFYLFYLITKIAEPLLR